VLSRRAIASTGLPRDEVFVTTKLWNLDQGYDETLAAFDRSLSALGMDVRIGPHPDAFETP
jgi:2,5-diketo-D-gluconate reductase A